MTASTLTGEKKGVITPAAHRESRAWKRGMELARVIFSNTESMSGDDSRVLKKELMENVIKIPTRIALGYAVGSKAEFLRNIARSRSLLAALDTQILLAHQLNLISFDQRRRTEVLVIEMHRLLEQLGTTLD